MRLLFIALFCLCAGSAVAETIDRTNQAMIGQITEYHATYEDTFVHLARDYDLGYVELRAANPLVDPWIPGEGTALILPTAHLFPEAPHEGIVINIPEMRLYYFGQEAQANAALQSFPLGIGREGLETPRGQTSIVRKKEGPTWRPTPRMLKEDPELDPVVPPGPENPLGTHALYLGWKEYMIHGTNKPFGIGRRVSSGCIRMYPKDIITLYGLADTGTKVNVINQPVKMAWVGDRLYIEAHPTEAQAIEMEEHGRISYNPIPDEDIDRIIRLAGPDYGAIDWPLASQIYGLRLGYPIPVATRVPELSGPVEGQKESPLKERPAFDFATAKTAALEELARPEGAQKPARAPAIRPFSGTVND